jgi:hypothetical protein
MLLNAGAGSPTFKLAGLSSAAAHVTVHRANPRAKIVNVFMQYLLGCCETERKRRGRDDDRRARRPVKQKVFADTDPTLPAPASLLAQTIGREASFYTASRVHDMVCTYAALL